MESVWERLTEFVRSGEDAEEVLYNTIAGVASGGLEHLAQNVVPHLRVSVCGAAWAEGSLAYRCADCETSPSSALCAACFNASDHEGHDYKMYKSGFGGVCDCGNDRAWDPAGFCSHHKGHDPDFNPLSQLDPDLLGRARLVLSAFLDLLAALLAPHAAPLPLRLGLSDQERQDLDKETRDARAISLMGIIGPLSELSDAFRRIVVEVLSYPVPLTCSPPDRETAWTLFAALGNEVLGSPEPLDAVDFAAPLVPRHVDGIGPGMPPPGETFESLLDAMCSSFLTHGPELNDAFSSFIMSLLNDFGMKQQFMRVFIGYYTHMATQLPVLAMGSPGSVTADSSAKSSSTISSTACLPSSFPSPTSCSRSPTRSGSSRPLWAPSMTFLSLPRSLSSTARKTWPPRSRPWRLGYPTLSTLR